MRIYDYDSKNKAQARRTYFFIPRLRISNTRIIKRLISITTNKNKKKKKKAFAFRERLLYTETCLDHAGAIVADKGLDFVGVGHFSIW